MKSRVAIVLGIRTPFCKAGGHLKGMEADDLGAHAVKELVARMPFDPTLVDEVIIGNVMQPANLANIARIVAIKGGVPESVPAFTVSRNCASGMEAVTTAASKILLGKADIIIAGGVESMSHFPILYPDSMREFLQRLSRSRGWLSRLKDLTRFRFSMLTPQMPGLNDPLCGLSMGQTAELLVRDFRITREEQDQFALESQQRAFRAIQSGRFKEEIAPIPLPPDYTMIQEDDDGPRANQTLEALQKLKPVFDPMTGTVTAGNSSQVTDGAVALLLMSESKARELKLQPLGYLRDCASAGLSPSRMGLGPVFATSRLLERTGISMETVDLVEINEAFASQVLAVMRAFGSDDFARQHLKRDRALGIIDRQILNVNGGAIALGHPLGASGARLILTLLLELRRQEKRVGLAALCIGGGQGEACLLEVE